LHPNCINLSIADSNKLPNFDKVAFELLFKSHFKGMVLLANRYVKDFDSAKEIAQDSFVSLWEKKETIDTSKPVKSYLTTIVYNKSLNYLRDHKKFNRELLQAENLFPFISGSESDDEVISGELKNKIESAINELPEKCREVFQLNRFQDMKYQQIADFLNISVKTVEAQMSKALKHMREKLGGYITIILLLISIK
jgi:RNA polymerase sigma-70 factor, ECF subfamily